MNEITLLITGLALGTFAIRFAGFLVGARLPRTGVWAQALTALPGSLIAALLATQLASGGPAEWGAGIIALGTAILTRSLPLTMIVGLVAIAGLRAL